MFRVRLVLVRGEERWTFRVGQGFRSVNGMAAAAFLVAGAALGTWVVPLVLALLALGAALYEESARFDKATGRAEFRWGLVMVHRTRSFALADVAEVRVTQFGPARFVGLEVGLRDGTTLTLENGRGKTSSERLLAWGSELAQWLGVPLRT